jgi:hypothetical protein
VCPGSRLRCQISDIAKLPRSHRRSLMTDFQRLISRRLRLALLVCRLVFMSLHNCKSTAQAQNEKKAMSCPFTRILRGERRARATAFARAGRESPRTSKMSCLKITAGHGTVGQRCFS